MWGPGAEQGGILQTSSGKLDLKEPYYRMSQPQAYPMSQDQQPPQLLQTQVTTMWLCLTLNYKSFCFFLGFERIWYTRLPSSINLFCLSGMNVCF